MFPNAISSSSDECIRSFPIPSHVVGTGLEVVAVEVVQRGEETAREGEKAEGCEGVEDGFGEMGKEAVNTL